MEHQILFVSKPVNPPGETTTTHVGGRNPDGSCWRITQQAAIEGIETGQWGFFVVHGKEHVELLVAMDDRGGKCLRTRANDNWQAWLPALSDEGN